MQAQAAQVGDRVEPVEQLREGPVVQHQGVAAAQDRLGEGLVGGDPGQCLPRAYPLSAHLRVGEVSAKAVAAVDGTGPVGHQEGAPIVFVQQSGRASGRTVPNRVRQVAGGLGKLRLQRQDLAKQGVPRIAGGHQGRKSMGYEQSKRTWLRVQVRDLQGVDPEIREQCCRIPVGARQVAPPGVGLTGADASRYHCRV